ncbi:hypothetical protein E2C01_051077 [Portunus trituberculatus]|uniref:Uncharacterized protein n=1 Tax=Portunus trituberculatus TaxID=210409 RepID=A0A5B7GI38_PORTR|nr:hypothetical protein [Portunus trituberculatus]
MEERKTWKTSRRKRDFHTISRESTELPRRRQASRRLTASKGRQQRHRCLVPVDNDPLAGGPSIHPAIHQHVSDTQIRLQTSNHVNHRHTSLHSTTPPTTTKTTSLHDSSARQKLLPTVPTHHSCIRPFPDTLIFHYLFI